MAGLRDHTTPLTSTHRTVPLFALLEWFTFVCSNGLVGGTTHAAMRHDHRPPLRIDELEPVLTQAPHSRSAH
jgi:hypothetical protein